MVVTFVVIVGLAILLAILLTFLAMIVLTASRVFAASLKYRARKSFLVVLTVGFTMFFLATIFVSLVSGDILAKETEDGNLRLILARPILPIAYV